MRKRGQSTLEYGIIIAVVVGALLLMSTYVRRGYQGRLRDSADDMGTQFDPFATNSHFVTTSISYQNQRTEHGLTYQSSQPISEGGIKGNFQNIVTEYGNFGEVQVTTGNETTSSWKE